MSGKGKSINSDKRANPPMPRGPSTAIGQIAQWDGQTWVPINLADAIQVLIDSGAVVVGEGGGGGTVTSVALTMPKEFDPTITGSPITTSGTLDVELVVQGANQVWAGPTSGASAEPSFRALVSDDLPPLSTVSVAFTDGDTMRRVTVSDAAVTATSKILVSVVRTTVTDENDPGIFFEANVVSRGEGTFDVLIVARGWGFSDPVGIVNETITLNYLVSA